MVNFATIGYMAAVAIGICRNRFNPGYDRLRSGQGLLALEGKKRLVDAEIAQPLENPQTDRQLVRWRHYSPLSAVAGSTRAARYAGYNVARMLISKETNMMTTISTIRTSVGTLSK